ncbi:hypothetical protein I0C86_06775, partial [Plantactinospora sp. S1510]
MNVRTAFITAPLLTLAYGVIRILDGLDGSRGPGIAWTVGHLAFIAALALFVSTFWQMRDLAARSRTATALAAIGTAGIAVLVIQFGIDLVVGFISTDRAEMATHFERIQSVPGVSLAIYDGGPFLFYLAQLAIVVLLAVTRRVKVWTPVLVALDLALPFVDKDLIPVGAVFLLVSFIPLYRT